MIRLDLKREPYWLDLAPGVRIRVRPCTTALVMAARASMTADGEGDDDNARAAAMLKAMARVGRSSTGRASATRPARRSRRRPSASMRCSTSIRPSAPSRRRTSCRRWCWTRKKTPARPRRMALRRRPRVLPRLPEQRRAVRQGARWRQTCHGAWPGGQALPLRRDNAGQL
jgi:hypothetical protein